MTLFWCITAGVGGGLIGGALVSFTIEYINRRERREEAAYSDAARPLTDTDKEAIKVFDSLASKLGLESIDKENANIKR